jgi:hypothetical protein
MVAEVAVVAVVLVLVPVLVLWGATAGAMALVCT